MKDKEIYKALFYDKNDTIISDTNKAFEEFIKYYFEAGFGTLTKSDIDLLVFYIVCNYTNYRSDSDFDLAKKLQITPQRVRFLHEKSAMKYYDFTKNELTLISSFLDKCQKASPDGIYVDIPVNDPKIKYLIENLLASNDIILHSQLNSRICRLKYNDFITLLYLIQNKYIELDFSDNINGLTKKLKEKDVLNQEAYDKITNTDSIKEIVKNLTNIKNPANLIEIMGNLNDLYKNFKERISEKMKMNNIQS